MKDIQNNQCWVLFQIDLPLLTVSKAFAMYLSFRKAVIDEADCYFKQSLSLTLLQEFLFAHEAIDI